jgi:hypothetical protein
MVDNTGGCMNYIYERMMAEGETAIFDRDELRKFEAYVAANYESFYDNKASYEVRKDGEKFLVTLFENPVITMEDILLDIRD